MIPYCPRSEDKNLSLAYYTMMARLRDGDWACFIDHDARFTSYDWHAQLEEITAGSTCPYMLTAMTNRTGSWSQMASGLDRDEQSMAYHRHVGAGF